MKIRTNTAMVFLSFGILSLLSQSVLTNAQAQIYYFSDFETNDGGLTGNGSWEWGVPFAGPGMAFSDFLCWGTNLNGDYESLSGDYLDTSPIDLTGASFPELSFMQWFQFEADGLIPFDGGNVKVSANGGSFEVIKPFWDYDGVIRVKENTSYGESVFSGYDNGNFWHLKRFNLEKFIGKSIVIRFQIGSDSKLNYSGWYIDDLCVKENDTIDVGIWSLDEPSESSIDMNLPTIPEASVYNAHFKPLTFDVEVSVQLNGLQEYRSTRTVENLASDDKARIFFDPWNPTVTGSFDMCVRTLQIDDADSSNDVKSFSGEILNPLFSNVTSIAGLDSIENTWVSWGDYNNDGMEDLVSQQGMLYKNNGDGKFKRVKFFKEAGGSISSTSASWIDFNNDGNLDLSFSVGNWNIAPVLYENNGNGEFDYITKLAGFTADSHNATAATWADYDNDGFVDWCYGGHWEVGLDVKNSMYRNGGDETFADVAETVGLGLGGDPVHSIRGIYWCDYDNDGDSDLFVIHSDEIRLFNNESGSYFNDVTELVGIIDEGRVGICCSAWGDYDNDGFFDLFITRYDKPDQLYKNSGNGTFSELASSLHIAREIMSLDVSWIDYDNDGDLDLFLSADPLDDCELYQNNGDATFSKTSRRLFRSYATDWERDLRISSADYDSDGDLDLFLNGTLYRNNNSTANNWLHVKTRGTFSNRAGIGAQVRIVSCGISQIRQVTAGTGRCQNSLPVEFGLGSCVRVDTLFVHWPSGIVDQATDVAINQIVTVIEGNGITAGIDREIRGFSSPGVIALKQNYPNPFNAQTTIPFELYRRSHVTIAIYNCWGQNIATLLNEVKEPGQYRVEWPGTDDKGLSVSSGLYVIKIEAEKNTGMKKILMIR